MKRFVCTLTLISCLFLFSVKDVLYVFLGIVSAGELYSNRHKKWLQVSPRKVILVAAASQFKIAACWKGSQDKRIYCSCALHKHNVET